MKKSLVFVIFTLCMCLCLNQTGPAQGQVETSVLKVVSVTGKVMAKITPATDWTEAKVGQGLKKQDYIKTEADSTAILELPDRSSLSLSANTVILVEELVWDNALKEVGVNMSSGGLRAIINKIGTPSKFRVKTPTAICGARGTVFYIVIEGDSTRVFVTEGSVDFTNIGTGDSFVVVENMTALATMTGTEAPTEITGDQKQAVLDAWEDTENPPADEGEERINEVQKKDVTLENPAQENKGQDEKPVSPI